MKSPLLALLCSLSCLALAQTPARPAITGIAFVRFYTTNLPAATKFYGGTLGFDGFQAQGNWVYPVNTSQWLEIVPANPPDPDRRMAAVAFTTRNAAGLMRYLQSRGVAIEQKLVHGEFAVRDPEGHLVFFVQQDSNRAVAQSRPAPHATSQRIIHAGFIVQDQAKEDAFWKEILGFHPYWHGGHTDDTLDWASLQVPEGTDWLEYMLNLGSHVTLQRAGVADHVSLGVSHMPDVVAALARNGCEGANCSNSKTGRDGKTQLNLFDPDLTRIEFMEFAPVHEPCCSPFTGRQPGPVEDR